MSNIIFKPVKIMERNLMSVDQKKFDLDEITLKARLRANFAGAINFKHTPSDLGGITLVGGLADQTGQDLYPNDRDYNRHTFKTMARLGLMMRPTFSINLRNMNYGADHNFLKNPVPSDVLVIPYVLQPPENYPEKLSNKGIFEHDPHGADRTKWAQATHISNPRLVVVFAGASENEILPDDLEQKNYVWPRNLCPGFDDRSGMLFRRDYAEQLVAQKPYGFLSNELKSVL
jgi:hypothetical protein